MGLSASTHTPTNIAISTALFGPDNNKYLNFLPTFAWSLGLTMEDNFDVVFHLSPNLIPAVRTAFESHARHITDEGRLKFVPLAPEGLNNITAAAQRFEYFAQTPEGQAYDAIAFVDVDDAFPEGYVTVMADKLGAWKADMVVGNYYLVRKSDMLFDGTYYLSTGLEHGERITFDHLLERNCIGLSNMMMRPDVLRFSNPERLRQFSDKKCMHSAPDWPVAALASARDADIRFVGDTHVFYRQHDNLSGIERTDVPSILKAFQIKTVLYEDLARQDMPERQKEKVVALAETFRSMGARFFKRDVLSIDYDRPITDEMVTPEFRDYIARCQTKAKNRNLWFWEAAYREPV